MNCYGQWRTVGSLPPTMNIYQVAGLIFFFGVVGGIVNCMVVGARKLLPGYDQGRHWHPGWTGSALIGGVAAALIWGIYGSSASFDLLGQTPFEGHLTVAQLFTSAAVGMGGSRILTLEAQKWILTYQRDREEAAKDNVAKVIETLFDQRKDT